MQEQSLKNKTVKGLAWSSIENFANLGISFCFGVFLARMLTPSEYGTIGMINVFLAISSCFVNSGFGNALIRKKNRTESDNATVFYFNVVVAVIFYLLLYFCAPWIASFYEMPILTAITRVVGLNLIIQSLCMVQSNLLSAKLDFKTLAKVSLTCNIVGGVVGVSLAYSGYGVWSLVWQGLIANLLTTALMWLFGKWYPKESFSWSSFRELFGYGSKLLASALLDRVYNNIYPILIGKLFSASALGLYTRASGYASLPSSNLTGVIQKVTFPVLSEIQDDDVRLANDYRRLLRMSAFIIFPCMMLLFGIADPLIRLMITNKWAGCIIYLQIMCFSMMWYPIHAINLNLLQVKGRSDLFLRLEIIKKIIGVSILFVSYRWGVIGLCYGGIVSSILCLIVNTYYTGKLINVGFIKQMFDLVPIFINSLIGGLFALTIVSYLPDSHQLSVILGITVFVVYYIGITYLTHSRDLQEVITIVKRRA